MKFSINKDHWIEMLKKNLSFFIMKTRENVEKAVYLKWFYGMKKKIIYKQKKRFLNIV